MVSKHLSKVNFLRIFFACGLLAIFILVTTVDKCVAMFSKENITRQEFVTLQPPNNNNININNSIEGAAPPTQQQRKYSGPIIDKIKEKTVFYKIVIAVSILLICFSFRYFYVECNQMTNLEKEKRKKMEEERRQKEEEERRQKEEEERRQKEEEERRQKEEEERRQKEEEERRQKEEKVRREQKSENKTPTGERELETKQNSSNFNTGMKVNTVVLGTGLLLTCAYALINEYFKVKSKNSEGNEAQEQVSCVTKDAEKSADEKVLDTGNVLEDIQNVDKRNLKLQDINLKKSKTK